MKAKLPSPRAAAATLSLLMAGCAVGPRYVQPSAPITPAFKEADGWRPSAPADSIDRGAWWSMYKDPALDQLEQRVATSNQTVKQYEAAYRQAHDIVKEAQASFFPTIGASLQTQRSNGASASTATGAPAAITPLPSGGGTSSRATGLLEASWVPDLWGKVRKTVESDKALAQAGAAELAGAKLSAQSALAQDYFQLRVLDEQSGLYRDTVADYEKYLQLTKDQYEGGTQPLAAVLAAQTQLLTARSSLIALGAMRAKMEHAIAVLTGAPPADLSIPPAALNRDPPVPPAGVPSTLLERRPDIAAAEREVAAANAQIGVAMSAYFPDLTLSAQGGGSASGLGALLGSSTSLWSVGAQLVGTIFDFGARHAQVAASRAAYDENVAMYRQTVLNAFQGVEDQLAALRVYQDQEAVALQAETAASKAAQLDLVQYREGMVDYTTVIVGQTAALSASQNVLTVLQQRLQASVLLVEDLGGGWEVADLPKG